MRREDPKQRSVDRQRATEVVGQPGHRHASGAGLPPSPGTRPLIKSQAVPVQRRSLASRLPTREVSEGPALDWTNAVFRPDLYRQPVMDKSPMNAGRVGGAQLLPNQGEGVSTGAAPLQRKIPGRAPTQAGANTPAEPAIAGPLQPGETRASGAVTVEEVSAHSTVIKLGESRIAIDGTGTGGSGYSYHVDAGRGTRQRVVRIVATPDVAIGEQHDPHAEQQLICHCWRVPSSALAEAQPRTLAGAKAPDSESDILTQVQSEGQRLVAVNLSLMGAAWTSEPMSPVPPSAMTWMSAGAAQAVLRAW